MRTMLKSWTRSWAVRSRVANLMVSSVMLSSVALMSLLGASPAEASTGVWWHPTVASYPTHMEPGMTAWIRVSATNRGYAPADLEAAPLTLTDKLPPGLEATAITGFVTIERNGNCTLVPLQCVWNGAEPLYPYTKDSMVIMVKVKADATNGEMNEMKITGGGGAATTLKSRFAIEPGASEGKPKYEVEQYEIAPEEVGGELDTQAGSHPFQLTTTVALGRPDLSPEFAAPILHPVPNPAERQPPLPKDINIKLPPGLVGNPTPLPKCSSAQFTAAEEWESNACPENTAVGVAKILIYEAKALGGYEWYDTPVFNLQPEPGEPARFGFTVLKAPVYLDTAVRTGGDYGVTVHVGNISQLPILEESEVTFWGVPGDPRHDAARGWACANTELFQSIKPTCTHLEEPAPQPLLVLPTSCTGPLVTTLETDSWAAPHNVLTYQPSSTMPALDGCNRLAFKPEVRLTPDSQSASTASGLTVDVHVPQDESLVQSGLSESNVKDTTVTLPEGLVLNPSAADGLQACSLNEIGLESSAASSCRNAAKVGTVTIHTPLLPEPLSGAAYLAEQNANPFGSLVALYVVAEDKKAGVLVKLAGEVHLSPSGQITSTFTNTPQLPFEDFELTFFGGARAPLATPDSCGSYTTNASIAPWSGTPAVGSSSTFLITSGPEGAPCSSQLGFSPSLIGGTENLQAGEFSPLVTTMSRNDGEQPIKSVTLKFPPGMMGSLVGVELCKETQADAGTCGPNSLIGHTIVSVGIGGDPYSVTGGRVYMTGPYHGAPFGLSIVQPAVAGPFNLGTVVVRAKVEVDPLTSQLTVTTDPSGSHAIPQILDGIPLQIRHVNVTVDRNDFTFNPTSCEKMQIKGTIESASGVQRALTVPFQVANCARLAFKPKFTAATDANMSRKNGASLHVALTYPNAPQGTQANIKSVHVELPKALPSRLSTLNHACVDSVFNQNPANCPSESRVGFAKAVTPVLPVPLEGPAYFVSHGGQKFPELIVVLQGYGVTVDLRGETFISKAGITSSTFKSVPDVPVGSFELALPEGPFSALAANRDLCTASLSMPTRFTGQNGAVLEQKPAIEVQGCPYALRIVGRHVHKRNLTLRISVPVAGKLVAFGKGVSKASKSAKGRQTLTLTLKERQGGKLRTRIALRFTPAGPAGKQRGKKAKILHKRLTVTFR